MTYATQKDLTCQLTLTHCNTFKEILAVLIDSTPMSNCQSSLRGKPMFENTDLRFYGGLYWELLVPYRSHVVQDVTQCLNEP